MLFLSFNFSKEIPREHLKGNFPTWLLDMSSVQCLSLSDLGCSPSEYSEKDIVLVGGEILNKIVPILLKNKNLLLEYQKFLSRENGLHNSGLLTVSLNYVYKGKPFLHKGTSTEGKYPYTLKEKIKSRFLSFFKGLGLFEKKYSLDDDEEKFLEESEELITYTILLKKWTLNRSFFSSLKSYNKGGGKSRQELVKGGALGEIFLSVSDVFAYRSVVSTYPDFEDIGEDEYNQEVLTSGERGFSE